MFIVVVMGGLTFYYKIEFDRKMENPNQSDLAVLPDLYMSTADQRFHEYKAATAVNFLEKAIATMKILEKDGDSVSIDAIEIAIRDLQVVEEHIKSKDINDDFMYEAFADALNSMAYASLRVSEKFIKEGRDKEAKMTIDHAMDHLQNSIRFARGQQKEDEIRIAGHLQRIIENHWESDISQIDIVMAEIDSVVEAHVIQ